MSEVTYFPFFCVIFLTAGGLFVFLQGIGLLRQSFLSLNELRVTAFLQKYANSLASCLLLGIFCTILIQSSNAVTAIVLTLVSTKILSFRQGIYIILGTNIGTTFTSILISINFDYLALIFLLIGIILYLFFYNKPKKYLGDIFISLSLLFFGLIIMQEGLRFIIELPAVLNACMAVSNKPFLSFILGTFLTAAVQSSSACIAFLQSLYHMNLISLPASITFVFGANIGTTFTGLLLSLKKDKITKKTAYFSFAFNVFSALIFIIFLNPYIYINDYICNILNLKGKMVIASCHVIFNILSVMLCLILIWIYDQLLKKKLNPHLKRTEP